MLDFTFDVPTRILFGKNQMEKLGKEVAPYGTKVLLVYGGGSIKRSGLYDRVIDLLGASGITVKELAGVQANPRIDSVREGVRLCKENGLELVLAVGGGSSIDCAKAIAAGAMYDGDAWDFYVGKARIKKALPVGVVLTLAATGSEMNGNSVISNDATMQKLVIKHQALIPRFSILDPTLTYTVPAHQTAAGVADIMSHVYEQYFSNTEGTCVQDQLAIALLKVCVKYGPVAIKEPESYEARSNLMWAGTLALNGLLSAGKMTDWATHGIEHELSARYDMTHGLGLALLTPSWMEYVLTPESMGKFCSLSREVWGLDGEDSLELAKAGIEKNRAFFAALGLAGRLRDAGVEEDHLDDLATRAVARGSLGSFMKLEKDDVLAILRMAY